jgi:hypothetical protein
MEPANWFVEGYAMKQFFQLSLVSVGRQRSPSAADSGGVTIPFSQEATVAPDTRVASLDVDVAFAHHQPARPAGRSLCA